MKESIQVDITKKKKKYIWIRFNPGCSKDISAIFGKQDDDYQANPEVNIFFLIGKKQEKQLPRY